MKLESKENFFTLNGVCDKKNKLLRSNAKLTDEEVSKLDSGKLSIEDLNDLLAKKAKIFKYGTQITIHADFPREVENRVNGYAYLVNNKNGSVGIRYGAIDEDKRIYLKRFLSYEGFSYHKNSTEHDFNHIRRFKEREQAIEYVTELKGRYDYDTATKLLNGGFQIFGGVYWGMYYVVLKLTVNSIPQKNIPGLLKLLRCKSEDEIKTIEEKEEMKRRAELLQYEMEREERKKKEAEEAGEKRIKIINSLQDKYRR